jgi:acetyl esterase/lipase
LSATSTAAHGDRKHLSVFPSFLTLPQSLRDDKTNYSDLAQRLALSLGFPVAVPNYRLTPATPTPESHFRHPKHAEDLLEFLEFLMTWAGPEDVGPAFDSQTLFLLGHSCSAHMLASIFLDSSATSPTLTPSPSLLASVKGIAVSEGIYNIDSLLLRFPTYREQFIENTFGKHESYAQFDVSRYPLRSLGTFWLVLHSKEDTLVDEPQSEGMYRHLYDLYGEDKECISFNADALKGEHSAIFNGDEYLIVIGEFVSHVIGIIHG